MAQTSSLHSLLSRPSLVCSPGYRTSPGPVLYSKHHGLGIPLGREKRSSGAPLSGRAYISQTVSAERNVTIEQRGRTLSGEPTWWCSGLRGQHHHWMKGPLLVVAILAPPPYISGSSMGNT